MTVDQLYEDRDVCTCKDRCRARVWRQEVSGGFPAVLLPDAALAGQGCAGEGEGEDKGEERARSGASRGRGQV
jgi:hypothetical protein